MIKTSPRMKSNPENSKATIAMIIYTYNALDCRATTYISPNINKTSRIRNRINLPYFLPLFPTLAQFILNGLRKSKIVSKMI